ncbi:hypothetical protein [Massilia haematophila]|uniref:Uncharacterized protein n=1 Tax=Massilia haematophila TaxID=457923 RepID=A0ABV7PFK9_9BURK
MGENKGHGMKGNNYDELSGVGTSSAGITGTTGNLNNGVRDGGIGKPSARDAGNRAGNRQSAELDDGDVTPALGTGTRGSAGNKQGGQPRQSGSLQSGSQQSGSQQSGSQQGQPQQGQSQQSGAQEGLGRSLDQDVMGKEQ